MKSGDRTARIKASERQACLGFTLMELLVACVVFVMVLAITLSVIGQASSIWRSSSEKIEAFQDARGAFELMTRNLSQATLNTFLDYDNPSAPTEYLRRSDLRFLSGPAGQAPFPGTLGCGQAMFFQAPASLTRVPDDFGGLEGLLNACGYYVQFGSDVADKPSFVSAPPKYRYRLMQMIVPTEMNSIFTGGEGWFADHLSEALPIASNVIALIVRPQDPARVPPDFFSDYHYDTAATFSGVQPATSQQLPPVVSVTLIAIGERSATRLAETAGTSEPMVITSVLAGKFSDPALYEVDMQSVETALSQANPPIDYRVFQTAIPIRESRWTR